MSEEERCLRCKKVIKEGYHCLTCCAQLEGREEIDAHRKGSKKKSIIGCEGALLNPLLEE